MEGLRKKLKETAFWDGWVCLNCGELQLEREPDGECPECEHDDLMVRAKLLSHFLTRLDQDDD